jgi:hypothetical protein
MEQLVTADEFVLAAEKKSQIVVQVAEITQLPVCMRCWIEAPSAKTRQHLHDLHIEKWTYYLHHMVCSQCASLKGTPDGRKGHFDDMTLSLRRRVQAQLFQAQEMLPTTCSEKMRSNLDKALEAVRLKVGQGRGAKRKRGEVEEAGSLLEGRVLQLFASQAHWTLDRLLPEADMREHRAALLLAVRALELQ